MLGEVFHDELPTLRNLNLYNFKKRLLIPQKDYLNFMRHYESGYITIASASTPASKGEQSSCYVQSAIKY